MEEAYPRDFYNSVYQNYVTAEAYSREENAVIVNMAPGSGKTYIVIKLIKLHTQAGF